MKISITISDVEPNDALRLVDLLNDFEPAQERKSSEDMIADTKNMLADAASPSKPAKPKRKRRTKEQMAEDKAAEAVPVGAAPTTSRRRRAATAPAEPTQRRRRTPAPASPAEPAPNGNAAGDAAPAGSASAGENPTAAAPVVEESGGTAEATTASFASLSDDEVTDNDVAKAASAAAEQLTPDVVMSVLEEFGVASVGMLDQNARRDFISILDLKVDDSLPNG